MWYNYAACKKSLEFKFGLVALGKIEFLSSVSHRQSSGASLWGGNWTSKLLAEVDIPPLLFCAKKEVLASGESIRSGMGAGMLGRHADAVALVTEMLLGRMEKGIYRVRRRRLMLRNIGSNEVV
ncbi:hypothetical protein TNCV_3159511 [Trichonephila clavipes]|nr:hypothetical protein TNCV_3159511 [Trichonephila clavipes]